MLPRLPFMLAAMTVVPWVEPAVASPLELIVATDVLLELHVTRLVMS